MGTESDDSSSGSSSLSSSSVLINSIKSIDSSPSSSNMLISSEIVSSSASSLACSFSASDNSMRLIFPSPFLSSLRKNEPGLISIESMKSVSKSIGFTATSDSISISIDSMTSINSNASIRPLESLSTREIIPIISPGER